ncbi:MAG: GNAT family N-acetyltransferase [Chloroflexota bacterium]
MTIQVRTAVPDDAEGVVAVFNPIIETGLYTIFDTPFTVEEERAFIEGFHPRGVFHVAVNTETQQIVGFQSMEPFAAYTGALAHVGTIGTFVDLNQRRQGIAAALFAATFEAAKQRGFEKLFTFIRADNITALTVYMSRGFRIIGTAQRQAKIHGQYVDEILVEKFL